MNSSGRISKEAPLKPKWRQSFRSSSDTYSKTTRLLAVALLFAFAANGATAATQPPAKVSRKSPTGAKPRISLALSKTPAYSLLEEKALKTEKENHVNGWGYIISGGAVMAISIPAYYATDDVFAKVVYTAGQTIGLGAITYGSSLVLINDEYVSFYHLLKDTPGLTSDNREALANGFFLKSAEQAKRGRKIRVIGHSLGALVNFVNAATASNSDLRAALYFIGGINTLATINYLFKESDEEKAADCLMAERHTVAIEPLLGPVVGLQAHW